MTKNPSLDTLASLSSPEVIKASFNRLENKWTQVAGTEVQSEIGSAAGYDGYIKLLGTQEFLTTQLNTFSKAGTVKPFFTSLKDKIHVLGVEQAAIEKKKYDVFRSKESTGLAKLAEAKQREIALDKAFGKQLVSPEFSAFTDERKSYREKVITQNIQLLNDKIKIAQTVPEIDALIDMYVYEADVNSIAAKPVLLAVQDRKSIIAPFTKLAGGEYLNAVYSGDINEIRKFDRAYTQTFSNMMGSLGPLFFNNRMSLVVPMLTSYLLNYQSSSGKCLRSDAVSFTVSTRYDDVTTNGWGAEIARTYSHTVRDNYTVNKEFYSAFKQLGTKEAGSMVLPDLLLNNGKISNILLGTYQMMTSYKCDDPRVKRMEKNMLNVYNQL